MQTPLQITFRDMEPSAAISGISKNSPGTGLATLRLDSESVKMPIQVVRDVADFIVSPP